MGDQCSLVNDLRGGDHHKRRVMLAGVNHDERCLEAAAEIERLRRLLSVNGAVCEECGEIAHDLGSDEWAYCSIHLKETSE